MISVCDESYLAPMFYACFPAFVLALLLKPQLLFNRRLWRRLFRGSFVSKEVKMADRKRGFAQVIIVTVCSRFRGQGVFSELLEETKHLSIKRGSWAIRAGVYKDNISSLNAFTKAGWKEWPELRTQDTMTFVSLLKPDQDQEVHIT